MKIVRSIALASLFVAVGIAPAAAAWHGAGSVRFGSGFRHRSVAGPARPVRRVEVTARNNSVYCRNIRAVLRSGRRVTLYSGRLEQGRPMRLDLPGDRRRLDRLTFNCRSTHNWAYIEVAVETGRHHGGHGPAWYREGRRHLPDRDRWQRVGHERFVGHHDRETARAGWAGRLIDAIALRPVEDDARCRRVVAEFRHDERRDLDVYRYGVMRRGRYYIFHLPGHVRNLVRLHLACRAIGDRDVRIQIYSRSAR
jgi:hypothetical protein